MSRGVPRIYNWDKRIEIVGYAEVNKQATSVLGRVKIHKGYFYCDRDQVEDGDLVQDRDDGNYYLVMSSKVEKQGYEIIYYDSTLINCEDRVTVSRFGDGVRDAFGRVISSEPEVIASNVYCMINPKNFTVMDQQDRVVPQDKIQFYVQAKVGVKVADRLTSGNGRKYVVESVDTESLRNINILHVDLDER